MTSASAVLFLFKSEHPNPPPVVRQPTLTHNPPGIDHISFSVADVDQAYAELKAKGVEFSGEPANQRGLRIVGLEDPDGNNLYLLTYGGT